MGGCLSNGWTTLQWWPLEALYFTVLCVLSTNKTRTQSLLFLFSLVAKALNIWAARDLVSRAGGLREGAGQCKNDILVKYKEEMQWMDPPFREQKEEAGHSLEHLSFTAPITHLNRRAEHGQPQKQQKKLKGGRETRSCPRLIQYCGCHQNAKCTKRFFFLSSLYVWMKYSINVFTLISIWNHFFLTLSNSYFFYTTIHSYSCREKYI